MEPLLENSQNTIDSLVVPAANTVVQPATMMVKISNTFIARTAVLGLGSPETHKHTQTHTDTPLNGTQTVVLQSLVPQQAEGQP